ncbi:DUF1924 domain-containing protein [Azospirillum sp. YIM B02556]|uniref:DUF1924 domain-containing protein n=1 Tax=Azospirillum endophyticum TaxID=2800326 RepID=A0ABS1F222_9PROT|nr:DUF1924 domain-containing protein [Azospirillum endophyticum]MBK1837470.1 DUF1924 domain-containing protein [Azospirillum endophyticum]
MKPMIVLAAAAVLGTGVALAASGDPERARILDGYAAQAKAQLPAFAGFSAERGQALFLGPHAGGKLAETPACASCHTRDPAATGRHYKTGRDIPPMAVSANPKRFTDPAEVEKRFERDCVNVLGRACTAREKGDFITFLSNR